MNPTSKKIIIITGPTAVGKTDASIELALQSNTEIISTDSRQLYKEMSIGTAKPESQDLQKVPHHFIDHISITQPYTVGDYMREARKKIHQLFENKNTIILTGGTGLYIKALLHGINEFPEVTKETLEKLEQDVKEKGIAFLQNELKEKDPVTYKIIDLQNPRRLVRALSIIRMSGKPYSFFINKKAPPLNYPTLYFVLNRPREVLYERINQRVDYMMAQGLLEEAELLYPHRDLRALQTVGYQELFEYIKGNYSKEQAISKIKQHTRNYAKRQLTWFRGVDNAVYIDAQNNILNQINKVL